MKMTAPTNPTDYQVPNLPAKLDAFARLLQIMDDLREKCPWDRKQTFASLRNLTIEETYELADAILDGNQDDIREEVGDLLLHLVFYAKIAEESEKWDIAAALHGICDKLVARHPHVYGDLRLADAEAVKRNWEQLKLQSGKSSILQGVPTSLPAVVKAWRMQQKTAQVGFDWENGDQAWEKVQEEIGELRDAVRTGSSPDHIEEEFGDVLFSLINYARFIQVEPETALERVNRKFKRRFEYIESHADRNLADMSLAEMDRLWEEAKRNLP